MGRSVFFVKDRKGGFKFGLQLAKIWLLCTNYIGYSNVFLQFCDCKGKYIKSTSVAVIHMGVNKRIPKLKNTRLKRGCQNCNLAYFPLWNMFLIFKWSRLSPTATGDSCSLWSKRCRYSTVYHSSCRKSRKKDLNSHFECGSYLSRWTGLSTES